MKKWLVRENFDICLCVISILESEHWAMSRPFSDIFLKFAKFSSAACVIIHA